MFRIGERVLLLANLSDFRFADVGRAHLYNGTEVTVISRLLPNRMAMGGWIYVVRSCDGYQFGAIPEVLHRLPPAQPREDLRVVSWDECLWRPKQVPEAA